MEVKQHWASGKTRLETASKLLVLPAFSSDFGATSVQCQIMAPTGGSFSNRVSQKQHSQHQWGQVCFLFLGLQRFFSKLPKSPKSV